MSYFGFESEQHSGISVGELTDMVVTRDYKGNTIGSAFFAPIDNGEDKVYGETPGFKAALLGIIETADVCDEERQAA